MGAKKTLLAGIAAAGLLLIGAACQDTPADTPDATHTPDEGADVNATATLEIHTDQEASGITPLHLASALNDDTEVAMLLDRGADIEARDEQGNTPLHWAAERSDNPEVAALLLDRGRRHRGQGRARQDASELGGKVQLQPGGGRIAAGPGRGRRSQRELRQHATARRSTVQ